VTRPDIVVIGGSAGAVEAFETIIRRLPAHFAAAVFVVLHLGTGSTSSLVPILRRRALLNVKEAENGEPIRRGTVYVAAPGRHLMLEPDRVRVVPGPRENRHRPSIDVLFRSAARAFGERVIGVVLTGLLDDGAMGLRLIKEAGGMTLVQDPQDALFPSMPLAAIETGPDHVATVQRIPEILARIRRRSLCPASVRMATTLRPPAVWAPTLGTARASPASRRSSLVRSAAECYGKSMKAMPNASNAASATAIASPVWWMSTPIP
jgi:two-component system chemotaxis response regulator CheB